MYTHFYIYLFQCVYILGTPYIYIYIYILKVIRISFSYIILITISFMSSIESITPIKLHHKVLSEEI